MTAERRKAFLRIGQRAAQGLARAIALFEMGHQPPAAELGNPGGVAGTGHQAVAQGRCAIHHQRGTGAMGQEILIGLGGITGQGQLIQQLECHPRSCAIT